MNTIAVALLLAILVAGCTQPAGPDKNPPATTNPTSASTAPAASTTPSSTTATTQTSGGVYGATGALFVHYVDVGQGDGVIWQLPDTSIVIYDCGDEASSTATNPMTTYLRNVIGLAPGSHIRALIASHGHQDHIGGCEEILADYQVDAVYDEWYLGDDAPQSYKTFRQEVLAEGAIIHTLVDDPSIDDVHFAQGDYLDFGHGTGMSARIMWPPGPASSWDQIAEKSIAIQLQGGDYQFCFQGDIEAAQEATLASAQAPGFDCDVYLVGHHGSKYASSDAWLSKMDPEYAVVSFGPNSYGHPTSEALCRVQKQAKIYATDRLGNIVIGVAGLELHVSPDQPEDKNYCAPGASYWPTDSSTTSSSTSSSSSSSSSGSSTAVTITTILADPAGDDVAYGAGEYAEIRNDGTSDATLTSWTLRDTNGATYTFPTFTLGPGATVRVHTGSGANSAADLFWGRGLAVWNNDGDTATLRDSQGMTAATFTY